jgi:hypothetical protein
VTYSLGHVDDIQHLAKLADALERDLVNFRHMLDIYGDVMDLPGRRPAADPERTGRQATHGPHRPTEETALDLARSSLRLAAQHGVSRIAQAVALIRGTTAEMDRALGQWEGSPSSGVRGTHEGSSGAAEHDSAA